MPRDDCQAGYEDHSERELDSANEVFSKRCSGSRPAVFDSAARSRSTPLRDRQSLESRLTITHDVIADNLWPRFQFGPNVPIPNFASTCDMLVCELMALVQNSALRIRGATMRRSEPNPHQGEICAHHQPSGTGT